MIALFKRAGVLPHEVCRSELGIMISGAAVHKLAAIAPDQEKAAQFMTAVTEFMRRARRVLH